MHSALDIILRLCFVIFHKLNFSDPSEYIICVLCTQLLPQFLPIVLKLYRCFGHGLLMCICFASNLKIFFVLFSQTEILFCIFINYFQGMNVIRIKILG